MRPRLALDEDPGAVAAGVFHLLRVSGVWLTAGKPRRVSGGWQSADWRYVRCWGTASQLPLFLWLMHKDTMAKVKVDFRPNRIDEGNWQIIAVLPGHEDRHIKGLTSREDCYDWINGSRKIDWLRSQGYAK
jgi:hypothetical protein